MSKSIKEQTEKDPLIQKQIENDLDSEIKDEKEEKGSILVVAFLLMLFFQLG